MAQGTELAADVEVVGEWQSEPALSQLGTMQSTYKFNADSSFSNKLNMISFCEIQDGQNCEYFWIIHEGTYSIKNGLLTLKTENVKGVILHKGKNKPEINNQKVQPFSENYKAKIDAGKLVLTNMKSTASEIYSPVTSGKSE